MPSRRSRPPALVCQLLRVGGGPPVPGIPVGSELAVTVEVVVPGRVVLGTELVVPGTETVVGGTEVVLVVGTEVVLVVAGTEVVVVVVEVWKLLLTVVEQFTLLPPP